MTIDPIKELSEFIDFVSTNEKAQLTVVVGLTGAFMSAIIGIALNYIASSKA